jgi:hypothetical protein
VVGVVVGVAQWLWFKLMPVSWQRDDHILIMCSNDFEKEQVIQVHPQQSHD